MQFEIGARGGVGTAAVAQAELRAGANMLFVKEIGIFLTAATASTIGIGRPAATGTGGTGNITALPTDPDGPAAATVVATTGWTAAPTAPTQFLRRCLLPGTIGAGIIFTWPADRPLKVKAAASIVVWNIALSGICDVYFVFEE